MPSLILITGGSGFIGSAITRRLAQYGSQVRVADIVGPVNRIPNVEYYLGNLRDATFCAKIVEGCDIVYHFAANMGGMGTIHSTNDMAIYEDNHNMTIQLLKACYASKVKRFLFASSACVYPEDPVDRHIGPDGDIVLREDDVWARHFPPQPQGLYGLDKLNTELILSQSDKGLEIRIARFHNIFGPGGAWYNGREKAPAALIRKAIVANRLCYLNSREKPTFELWGDGTQRRSFLYIDDCVDGILALMHSSCSTPVNIGSDHAVTIDELATLALECADLTSDDVTIVKHLDKPLGVVARNSDNTFALSQLSPWAPQTSLKNGMKATYAWMSDELDKLCQPDLNSVAMLDRFSRSQLVDFNNASTFAILLPVTSRSINSSKSWINNLRTFVATLMSTTRAERLGMSDVSCSFSLKIFLLVDYDDTILLQVNAGISAVEEVFGETGVPVTTLLGYHDPGRVCSLWRQCARKAYEDPDITFFVLFGDDVELLSDGWMTRVYKEFTDISEKTGAPLGFGCVAFEDLSFPGMPTFPVVHRTHLDIFGGDVVPESFINQDGDPFLYQLYRRWGCSRMVEGMNLRNNVGGSLDARYEKQQTTGWTFGILDRATTITKEWLSAHKTLVEKKLTIDVVVPSFRVHLPLLERILALKPSDAVSTMFIIIIDDPSSSAIDALQREYERSPNVRIRINNTNIGASASRNRGMEESAAEWIIFLDDDVEPQPDLLFKAEENIRAHPDAAGFVCNVFFPPPDTIYTSAVHLAGVTYFWNIAEKISDNVPWGVTANLITRRNKDNIAFDLSFPKTGGGEDIDFCARKQRDDRFTFFAAPDVCVVHPWWKDGRRDYTRFYGWGFGDSGLLTKFPESTYRDYTPNSAEFLLIAVGLTVAGTVIFRSHIVMLGLTLAVSTVVANIVHDIYRIFYAHDFDCSTLPGRLGERKLVAGPAIVAAVMESAVIRMFSEAGKAVGILSRGNWHLLGLRFDWFIGRWGDLPRSNERRNGVQRATIIFLILVVYWGYLGVDK